MPIIEYSSPNIKGYNSKKVLIHLDFLPTIQIIDDECKRLGFIFWVTNSFRKETDILHGTVVNPVSMSNHKVGCAIDGNLQHIASGEWFNSVKMGDHKGIDQEVIEAIVARGVRFGGNFRTADNVHFDNALNITNPSRYRQLYREVQGHD
jgi:hypothetical protein